MMTKDEFIKACASLGYSNKKFATEYAKSKSGELTDDDFIEVHRLYQRLSERRAGHENDKWRSYQGTKSTKFLPKYTT